MRKRSLRYKQLGHANMFQNLMSKLTSSGKPPDPNKGADPNKGNDPNKKGSGDPNDPNNLNKNKGDPNDPNNQSLKNPLDTFKDLFKMDANKSEDKAPAFSLDQETLTKVVGSLDFAGQMSPELLDKLKSGDAETVQSTLNSLGRNVYATLMQHIPALTEKFVTASLEHSQKGLGKNVKQTLTQQTLAKIAADNPVLQHQLDTISTFLLEKYPDATPDWIAEQTGNFFVETAKVLSPDSFKKEGEGESTLHRDTRDVTQHPDFEWGKYLGSAPAASSKK